MFNLPIVLFISWDGGPYVTVTKTPSISTTVPDCHPPNDQYISNFVVQVHANLSGDSSITNLRLSLVNWYENFCCKSNPLFVADL